MWRLFKLTMHRIVSGTIDNIVTDKVLPLTAINSLIQHEYKFRMINPDYNIHLKSMHNSLVVKPDLNYDFPSSDQVLMAELDLLDLQGALGRPDQVVLTELLDQLDELEPLVHVVKEAHLETEVSILES